MSFFFYFKISPSTQSAAPLLAGLAEVGFAREVNAQYTPQTAVQVLTRGCYPKGVKWGLRIRLDNSTLVTGEVKKIQHG